MCSALGSSDVRGRRHRLCPAPSPLWAPRQADRAFLEDLWQVRESATLSAAWVSWFPRDVHLIFCACKNSPRTEWSPSTDPACHPFLLPKRWAALPGGRHGSPSMEPLSISTQRPPETGAPLSDGANAEIQPRCVPLQHKVTWNGVVLDVSPGTLSPAGVNQVPPVCPATSPTDGNKALF